MQGRRVSFRSPELKFTQVEIPMACKQTRPRWAVRAVAVARSVPSGL